MRGVVVAVGVLFPAVWCLAQQGPVAVQVAPVERRPVELTQPLVATIEPVTRSTLAAELAGLVAERAFDEGQLLEKGALLVRMKTDVLEARLNAAEAARTTAEANVAMAKAESENAEKELARNRELIERQVGSDKEFREAATRARVTASMVNSRAAEVQEKLAEVARLNLMIKKSEVHTPIAGVVSKRHVEVGQWVKEGDPVADIVQMDPLWVRVGVPEQVLPRINVGEEARVTIDALGRDEKFTATIDQILPEADAASRTFQVKLRLPNPKGRFRPGFFARATLLSKSESQWVVPKDAVVSRGPAAHVVAVRGGKAVIVPVKRGAAEGTMLAVVGDLNEKDQVVTRGNEALRGGEDLMIPPAPPAAAAATEPAARATGK